MPEISQEELDKLNKYKELGEPEEISSSLSELQQASRQNVINEAASLSGFKPTVLSRLASDVEITVADGKAMVGDKDLETYAEENWEDFLPSLKAEQAQPKIGMPFVKQPTKQVREVNNTKAVVSNVLKRTYSSVKAETH
jgi:hypothetical protein